MRKRMKKHSLGMWAALLFLLTGMAALPANAADVPEPEENGNTQSVSENTAEEYSKWAEIAEEYTAFRLEVPFISCAGKTDSRMIYLVLPDEHEAPVPLVYFAHYDLGAYPTELENYLGHGWAVACPADYSNETLIDDDLMFNNAALYLLKQREEIDPERVAVVGISAGGYTALMTSALQLGTCAVVAEYPVVNLYFEFGQYFPRAQMTSDMAAARGITLFPEVMQIAPSFAPVQEKLNGDAALSETLSPIAHTAEFSAPMAVVHYTSDLLVPVDQVARDLPYRPKGLTMPWGFSTRIGAYQPGISGKSMEELLAKEETCCERTVPEPAADPEMIRLPYQSGVRYNIAILDNGPVENHSTHSSAPLVPIDDSAYLTEMFALSLARTESLSAEKIRLLLHRYQGISPALPVYAGVDEDVYGSLTVYRMQILDDLGRWISDHSAAELDTLVRQAAAGQPDEAQLLMTWAEMVPLF